jgi:hypothetical protein
LPSSGGGAESVLRALSVLFGVVAVGCMIVAVAGMVTGRQGARAGFFLRAGAVVSFGVAVALNVAAH